MTDWNLLFYLIFWQKLCFLAESYLVVVVLIVNFPPTKTILLGHLKTHRKKQQKKHLIRNHRVWLEIMESLELRQDYFRDFVSPFIKACPQLRRFRMDMGRLTGTVDCFLDHGNLRGPPQCHPPQEIAGPNKALLRETNG